MERNVIFRDRQEVQAVDFNNFQDFARASLDDIVKDAVQDEKGWVDFTVNKTATAEVTVGPGRIYNAGAGYVSDADVVFDLISELPVANSKWVAIVAWGTEEETDTQPRDFLTDATTGATEPAAVPMQGLRKCNVGTVVGVAAPQPAKPTIDSSNIVVAWVLLGTTDVISITLVEENRLPQVARTDGRVSVIEAWKALIEPRVNALASDLAAVIAQIQQQAGLGEARFIQSLAVDVARLKELNELSDDHTDYGADRFLDLEESNTDDVNYLAKVEEGVRFSDAAANSTSIQLFNPLNPDVIVSNGFLLPKYTESKRFSVGPFFEELSISQYQFQTFDMVQRTVSRERIRYGETITVCTNSSWWQSGRYDPAQQVFFKAGDTWEVLEGDASRNHQQVRLRKFFKDTYTEYYWDRITIDHNISGQQIAQTFLNGQDGWLTSIGLNFTQKGATGNVDVALAQVAYGQPDLANLINKVTLNVTDILVSGDGTIETKVAFPATFLEAGKRYAIVLTTGGNHYVAMALGSAYAQGTFFNSLDGAYVQGTPNRDMMFSLYYAQFDRQRTVVDLQPLSLSGGITLIDILAPVVAPKSTDLQYEIQVAGTWTPLAEVTSGNTVLFGLPPLLPFRGVFNGTTDVQPGLDLTDSVLNYSRPRTTFKHISQADGGADDITLAAGSQNFKVIALLENFYETNHDLTCTIRKDGAGGEISPATTADEELDPPADAGDANHKRIRRTFTWTPTELTTPMTSVRITMDGATTSALDTFHVAERIFLANT
jgi:hypothetical protein